MPPAYPFLFISYLRLFVIVMESWPIHWSCFSFPVLSKKTTSHGDSEARYLTLMQTSPSFLRTELPPSSGNKWHPMRTALSLYFLPSTTPYHMKFTQVLLSPFTNSNSAPWLVLDLGSWTPTLS
jgi:hypothetical protein